MSSEVAPVSDRTRRAGLTGFGAFLQAGIGLAIGLLITPRIVQGLGSVQYGSWIMLIQFMSYLALFDIGNGALLKLNLAAQQHIDDPASKQRQVGAAVLGTSLTTPLYCGFAVILVLLLPYLLQQPADSLYEIQIAAVLLVASQIINRFGAIISFVLFGMNLDYKSIRLRVITITFVAFMDLFVIYMGWGLIGLATNKVIGMTLILTLLSIIAKRNVPWFGVRRPSRTEFLSLYRRNGWLLMSQWGSTLTESTDVVILGSIVGAASVTSYSLTGSLIRMIAAVYSSTVGGIYSGIGALFGRKQWATLYSVRLQIEILTIGILGAAGCVLLLFNRSFMDLWVGSDFFAGQFVNSAIILSWLLLVLLRFESGLLMGCLEVRSATLLNFSGGVISVLLAILLTYLLGMPGMLVGMILGRAGAVFGYVVFSNRLLQVHSSVYLRRLLRPVAVVLVLGAISYGIGLYVTIDSWLLLIAQSAGAGIVIICTVWWVGFDKTTKTELVLRFSQLLNSLILDHRKTAK